MQSCQVVMTVVSLTALPVACHGPAILESEPPPEIEGAKRDGMTWRSVFILLSIRKLRRNLK